MGISYQRFEIVMINGYARLVIGQKITYELL
jgi:hypothetical protein